MGASHSHWPTLGEAATLFCYFSVPIWNCSRGSSDLVLGPLRLSVCGIRRSEALFFFFLSACTCVLSACVCVFWGFVGARRGELGWEEGKKPQSSRAPATSPPPVLSSLRAPRQQGRRPLLIRDAADPLENRGPLRRGFLCRLELGCQGSLFAPTEPGVPPRPWEGLAAAAGADETAGSPLREGGGGVEAPSLGSSPHPRSSSRHLGGLLPFSSRRELRARPPLGSDPRAPDAPGCPDAPPSSLIVLIDP